jgi:hypothetical protein
MSDIWMGGGSEQGDTFAPGIRLATSLHTKDIVIACATLNTAPA